MGERGHGYTYGLFLLMCDRKPQTSVKQYPSITNTNKVAGKKKESCESGVQNPSEQYGSGYTGQSVRL